MNTVLVVWCGEVGVMADAPWCDQMLTATAVLLGKEMGFVLFPLIKNAWTFVFNLLMQPQHSIAP